MKSSFAFLMFICMGSFLNLVEAQSTDAKFDQLSLMMQFDGRWQCLAGNDTTIVFTLKLNGRGGESEFTYTTKGKTFTHGKQLWGYVPGIDKIIICQLVNDEWLQIWKIHFVAPTKAESHFYSMAAPDRELESWVMEFQSPDVFTETLISDKKKQVFTYVRMK